MRTITLEEHFAIPAFLEGPGRKLKEQTESFNLAASLSTCVHPTTSQENNQDALFAGFLIFSQVCGETRIQVAKDRTANLRRADDGQVGDATTMRRSDLRDQARRLSGIGLDRRQRDQGSLKKQEGLRSQVS